MSTTFRFDYYYGTEAEQFSFYRVPKTLIKDNRFKNLSSDAKILYGLMLDRMSLSMKHGWLDIENKVYIYYTMENIMDDLNCAKATAVKILSELDCKKGIGLIEKKRQGLGKPDIIYVKNFSTIEHTEIQEKEKTDESITDIKKVTYPQKESYQEKINKPNVNVFKKVKTVDLQKFENNNTENLEVKFAEVQNLDF